MLSPSKRVLSKYRTLLVKMYSDHFIKPTIPAAKVNEEFMTDIKCLLTLATMLPLLEAVKALVIFAQSPSVYVCDFTRAWSLYISYVNDLYCTKIAFISYAFSCFKKICDLSHENIRLRWHPNVNDCVEYLIFEAHLSTSTGSHLNATCLNHVTHLKNFVTRELFDRTISEVKVEAACMYLFLFLFICLCFCIFQLYRGFTSMSMGLMCWFWYVDAAAMMVMELKSRFPLVR